MRVRVTLVFSCIVLFGGAGLFKHGDAHAVASPPGSSVWLRLDCTCSNASVVKLDFGNVSSAPVPVALLRVGTNDSSEEGERVVSVLKNETGITVFLKNLTVDDSGVYTCTCLSKNGSDHGVSDNVTLTVGQFPGGSAARVRVGRGIPTPTTVHSTLGNSANAQNYKGTEGYLLGLVLLAAVLLLLFLLCIIPLLRFYCRKLLYHKTYIVNDGPV
ncbi:membrane protein De8 [Common bottlenose dolphin gammaherpesvirus 1 strain Sarasota]|uniref:Membrane protein De8 n=1 Tax=Common bottlenose dolphin gammaherpesvirus 1 strain Sarasota TaxID=2022783 RepID=A0A1Z1NEL1_9GAMA|nr:membrane protein De8 [Common bottlenose dolphin gammaherpesvirus 1 strain Sarasota]ARW78135.1 membrane protein De8 [Common bottlenose dolphin gammaherpesvirus 1 strain Sarasota]